MKNSKSDEIRLRGNSFILLLLRGRNSKMDEQAAYGTQGNGLTYSALFSDLIHIANPNYPHTHRKSTLIYTHIMVNKLVKTF